MPDKKSSAKTKSCFIVSAIGDSDSEARIHGEWLLEGIVYPAFEQFSHYAIKRSDMIRVPGMIDGQIISHLMNDDLVIADMTFLNANVFYEIGIRHAAQKPIIHMFRRDTNFKIPFDVHAFRAIEFETDRPIKIKSAKDTLVEYILATEQPDFKIENPITRALGAQKLEQNATPAERFMLDRIQALETRVFDCEFNHAELIEDKRLIHDIPSIGFSSKIKISTQENAQRDSSFNNILVRLAELAKPHWGDEVVTMWNLGRILILLRRDPTHEEFDAFSKASREIGGITNVERHI